MLSTFRFSLFALLVLLQLLAPLVHAHTEQNQLASMATGKLHLPGLESLDSNTLSIDNKKYGEATNAAFSEGLAIGIDHGIKPIPQKSFADSDHVYCLSISTWRPAMSLMVATINFSPHVIPSVVSFSFSAHSPRAPPALA